MARHIDVHPEPVENCFGCKTAGVGFQAQFSAAGGDPTRSVTDDNRTTITEHWDGRQDVVVRPDPVAFKAVASPDPS